MNILSDELPTSLVIKRVRYPIRTDFKTCVRIMLAFEPESELAAYEKRTILLLNLYRKVPPYSNLAVRKALWFLDGGDPLMSDESTPNDELRLYSWKMDSSLLFAAFKQTHNIDLNSETNLHWWKFLALFMDLGTETA
ncbi:MAG: Gp15 family bacteriophage protein, partial [Thermodesulfovibrionales bacterium]